MEPSYQIDDVVIEGVHVPARHRPVVREAVDALALSIAEVGLRTPISVYQDEDGEVHLVTGLHRLRACEKLGWDMIPAVFLDAEDANDRERWEIAENLHRAELTAQQRAEHVARWVALTNQKVPRQVVGKPSGGRPEGGAAAASRELGLGERDVQRAVKIASMDPEAKEAARVAGLDDNQSALLEVARAPAGEQVAKVEEVRSRREVAASTSHRVSVPRDPAKAAEALCKTFSVSELADLLEMLARALRARQEKEAA